MNAVKWIGGLCLAVPAIGLLAFGPRGTPPPPPGVTVVEYWEEWTGAEGEALREVVKDFNDGPGKQKGVYVNLLTTAGVLQKTLVSTAAGVPPDIAGLENTQLPQFAELDALEPLDGLAASSGITGERYKPVFWDTCHYKGKLYAMPSTPYDYALFYDQRFLDKHEDKLRAAGYDPSQPPKTIDQLDGYSKCLEEIDPDGHIEVAGYMPVEPGWIIPYTPYWFGGSWWDDKNARFDFLNPAVVKAFTWVQSYSKRLGVKQVQAFHAGVGNFDSPQNAFMAGQIAMEQQGTYMANFINVRNASMTGHWRAANFPGLTEELSHATYCDSNVFCIPRGAKHPKEAFEFLAYMQERGPMEKLCGMHCKISALKDVSDTFLKYNKNPYIKIFDDLAASPLARAAPQCPILPEVTEAFTAFQAQLVNMQVTPEEGLKAMQDRLQSSLDHFNAVQADRRKRAGLPPE